MQKGMREYLLVKLYDIPSLYFSTSNPRILKEQPFEIGSIEETKGEEEEDKEEESPTPSPPSTPTPSISKNSYASYTLRVGRN